VSGGNDLIHQAVRLRIMAALNMLSPEASIDFTRLKALTDTTDGNLGAHLDALERAGYVATEKLFEAKKPKTRIRATPAGRRAFAEHVAYLREIIDVAAPAAEI
jgi:DNA-binding MarR family transcriptional regulator